MTFFAINMLFSKDHSWQAASAPYSNPHVLTIHSGSACGAFLLSQKNPIFEDALWKYK